MIQITADHVFIERGDAHEGRDSELARQRERLRFPLPPGRRKGDVISSSSSRARSTAIDAFRLQQRGAGAASVSSGPASMFLACPRKECREDNSLPSSVTLSQERESARVPIFLPRLGRCVPR